MTTPAPFVAARPSRLSWLPALIVAVGLTLAGALAGALAGRGFSHFRTGDRTVTVPGVAARAARADLAIWPLRLVGTDDDLTAANAALAQSVARVRTFLDANGLSAANGTEITVQDFTVTDARSSQGTYAPGSRFVIRQTIVVRSTDPARVQAASQRVADLVQDGVVLSSGQEYGGGGPTFVFTKLNALKPAMIAEATAEARKGAEQFARDSKSSLGGIREASQGVFEIQPRDPAPGISQESQLVKTVRVVTTVVYGLRD